MPHPLDQGAASFLEGAENKCFRFVDFMSSSLALTQFCTQALRGDNQANTK